LTVEVPRPPSTSQLRSATGLDEGARKALLRLLLEGGLEHGHIAAAFLGAETYGDLDDYLRAVADVWGQDAAQRITTAIGVLTAQLTDETRLLDQGRARQEATVAATPIALLLSMPEPDFLTAIESSLPHLTDAFRKASLAGALNKVLERRGAPYRAEGVGAMTRIVWTGDAAVEEQVLRPAMSALDDPRLANGPKVEFDRARDELRAGDPGARKQAVAEACNAVESAMKVLLDEYGVTRPKPETAQKLFETLRDAGHVSAELQEVLLSAARFGNKKGRHGAGPVAHDVSTSEAEAVVSAAATAITFLASRLPKQAQRTGWLRRKS
jgi:hypothetical protein